MSKLSNTYEETGNDFEVPRGIYRARLRTAMEIPHPKKEDHDDLRLLFDIVADEDGEANYCIRKLYCPEHDGYAEFHYDRQFFFTHEEYAEIVKLGQLVEPSQLVGKYVDLEVVTKKVKGFKVAYSSIAGIYPPGTLIEDPDAEDVADEDNDGEENRQAA